MSQYRVVLTAKNTGCCPLYKPGDKVYVNLPDVDIDSSEKVCAFILAELLRMRIQLPPDMMCETNPQMQDKAEYLEEFQIKEGVLRCPRVATEVSFEVTVEEREENLAAHHEFRGREDKKKLIKQLQQIPLFSVISAQDLFDLLGEIKIKKFPPNYEVVVQGKVGRYLYIIYRGAVEILQGDKDSKQHVISTLQEQECFGEMSLLTGEPISNTVRTVVPSTILYFSRESFRSLLEKNPQMRVMLTRIMAKRIKETNRRIGIVIGSEMVGQLHAISLADLIQTLSVACCSGVLHLYTHGNVGNIYFSTGEVIDATTHTQSGAEAIYEMLHWQEGEFRFEETQHQQERSIHFGVTELLLEGARQMDERNREDDELSLGEWFQEEE